MTELGRVWRHRDLLWLLAITELKIRYKGSALGFLWGLLNPLVYLAILAFVFTHLFHRAMAEGEAQSYPLYLLAGLVPWTYVTQAINRGTRSVLANRPLLRKVALPAVLFPLSSALASLLNFLLSLPALLLLAWWLGAPLGWGSLYVFFGLAVLATFVTGAVLLVGCLNVFFRDLEHLTTLGLSMLFYVTPIIYDIAWIAPRAPQVANVLSWNPVTPILVGVRTPVVLAQWPGWEPVGAAAAIAAGTLVLGWSVFVKLQTRIPYHV
ncbi:MAG: ABC transporter permease [Planctomycetota bacterium]|jgi:ABC-type polysaccharide/polyol phosphate export permease